MRKFISSILIFILAFFTISVVKVSAKILSNDKGTVTVANNEIVNDDLFIKAQTAEVYGTVNGDVYIGAQNVTIQGTINGNLHIGAQIVNLDGNYKGNVYIGAQNVSVTGANINGSLLVGSQDLTLDSKTQIGGSILAGGENVNIDSQIKRNVFVGAGILSIGSNTVIGKDLYYATRKNMGRVNISPNAKIAGSTHKSESGPAQSEIQTVRSRGIAFLRAFKVVGSVISYLGALIIGFAYFKFFEKHFTKTAALITSSFWKSLGIGFLITISFIPGMILLLMTVVGIPIAGLAILLLLLFVYFSKIVVGLSFGNWCVKRFNWKMKTFSTFAIGLLVYYLVRFIPFIGGLAGLIVLWVGLGALVLSSFSTSK